MNCQLCQKELDACRDGKLPGNMMTQVKSHLEGCETCAGMYKLQILADKVMNQEKELQPDPFLATRIMTSIESIENSNYKPVMLFEQVIKPVFVTVSMAAAIFFGIMLGNLSRPATDRETMPVELALIDDASIESVNVLSNE